MGRSDMREVLSAAQCWPKKDNRDPNRCRIKYTGQARRRYFAVKHFCKDINQNWAHAPKFASDQAAISAQPRLRPAFANRFAVRDQAQKDHDKRPDRIGRIVVLPEREIAHICQRRNDQARYHQRNKRVDAKGQIACKAARHGALQVLLLRHA